jgi:hypothetical protein
MEMVTLLVAEGVELRNEASIEKGSLRDLCDAVRRRCDAESTDVSQY